MSSRRYIYAPVTEAEHQLVTRRAHAAGLSVAEWMRRAVNRYLFELDEDGELLKERKPELLEKMLPSHGRDTNR